MKIKALLFAAFSLTVFFSSCTIEKRLYRPGFHVEWKKAPSDNKHEEPALAERELATEGKVAAAIPVEEDITPSSFTDEVFASAGSVEFEITESIIRDEPSVLQRLSDDQYQEECETLVMTDGRRVIVKVLEINQTEIRYRKCDYDEGPVVVVNKTDVDQIVYANGAVDIISGYTTSPDGHKSTAATAPKRLEVLGLLSMIFGITGLFIFGIPFGLAAVILGFSSMGKFAARPDEFMGRGFMIAGIIIGFVAIIGMLLILAAGGV